ncbi:glycoside hydrolase family 18 protein [Pseudomonas aeruginosa]|uniref:glycoside hydrolase family 18 protein n=1 Tax=Pseudomonas aeruginosa TaxID=287 RepID=UPI0022506380|nr:glycoside hydrolase family 18 protein [Pseudomonas aeruginosa]MCX4210347.1 glycoside hydrolase family 18 protein [Pseudomonas aeruginosa]MCX4229183.1 glycoside hydrolase family 18 protein [Pseudomonas aeruginosa]
MKKIVNQRSGGGKPSAVGTVYKSGVLRYGRPDSRLVYPSDPGHPNYPESVRGTEKKYEMNRYDPAKEIERYSFTSGRVAKRVYNIYNPNNYRVSGYYTDWSQYDGRYEGLFADDKCGRGIDMMLLDDNGRSSIGYDKIIIGFAGIVGDKGEKKQIIDQAAIDFGRAIDQSTFVDGWGDVASYINCGFPGWVSNDYQALFNQNVAQGVLGGLRKLKERNPNLALSFSLGGWTMSEAFHWVARDEAKRRTLVSSVVDIFNRFPMFTELDIDWEYPGAPGNDGNTYTDDDEEFYRKLVQDMISALKAAGRGDVKISIAVAASVAKMEKANVPGMIEAGVYGINLMTYDFFGTPWAERLAHHTNLHRSNPEDSKEDSIDVAVEYLLAEGVPANKIFIGYAAYSRNARGAQVSSYSPLTGAYNPGDGTTTGSFESGVTEWYDLIYNYIDLEKQQGLNGFNVYTDHNADADYLYNPETGLFLSIDTPRSVKAKGEYVRKKGLGGLFTWTIDLDNGVLLNAAREGLGNSVQQQVIDMSPFYFYGINDQGR